MYLARDKHFGQKQLETWTCGWRISIKEMSAHTDILADVIAGALTAEHLSYYGDRGSKTVKAYYRLVLYRAWGLTAHRGWARLMLDRRGLVQAPNAPRDQSQHPRARSGYNEEAAYDSYMNPEPGF